MPFPEYPAIPLATFKNVIVTAVPGAEGLDLSCVETIHCSAADTILNFQLVQAADETGDYHFDMPDLEGDTAQLGALTISKSGKMLTMCNEVSLPGTIAITLKAHDANAPARRGAFDPEVVNTPEVNAPGVASHPR
jgi:hypothetical protein